MHGNLVADVGTGELFSAPYTVNGGGIGRGCINYVITAVYGVCGGGGGWVG